jgi:hypothetical protein
MRDIADYSKESQDEGWIMTFHGMHYVTKICGTEHVHVTMLNAELCPRVVAYSTLLVNAALPKPALVGQCHYRAVK